MMYNKGQADPRAIGVIVLAVIIWGVYSSAHDSGYNEGFLEANKSYTSCLQQMDSNAQYYQDLLNGKDSEIANLSKDRDFWRDRYLECQKRDPKLIVFPVLVFNEIVYNVLIIGIWFFLGFSLFKGTIKISFGEKIDSLIQRNYKIWLFIKILLWGIITFFILLGVVNFLRVFL